MVSNPLVFRTRFNVLFHLFSSKGGAKIVTHHLPSNFYTSLLFECKLTLDYHL